MEKIKNIKVIKIPTEESKNIEDEVLKRFIKYVKIDTASMEDSDKYPSTDKQWNLAKLLKQELEDIGLEDIELDEHCYLTATLPSNLKGDCKTLGLIAHIDTSPESPGGPVKPILHENYDGKRIVLPGDPNQIIDPKDNPALKEWIGSTIITSDGTTLLGADDKAGVSEIMTLLSYIKRHSEVPHCKIRIAFTPDEEVGAGTKYFNVKKFGADIAYTIDGGEAGAIDIETFNADGATLTFIGKEVHPGYAKGKMVNSIRMAAEAISMLPFYEAPETTEKKEGYLHPYVINGGVERTKIKVLLRDFTEEGLQRRRGILKDIAKKVECKFKGGRVELDIKESYKNMYQKLKDWPELIEKAKMSIELAGIKPKLSIVRGGTDGAMLTFKGLPTPNLFAGGYNFHSKREWIPVKAMVLGVKNLIYLVQMFTS